MNKHILDLLDHHVAKLPKIDRQTHDIAYAKLVADANKHKEPKKSTVEGLKRGGKGMSVSKDEFALRVKVYQRFGNNYSLGSKHLGINYKSWINWVRNNKTKIEKALEKKKGGLRLSAEETDKRIKIYKKHSNDYKKCSELAKIQLTTWHQWVRTNQELLNVD